jgi:hypothetical protein
MRGAHAPHAPRGTWLATALSASLAAATLVLFAAPTADAFYGNGAQIVSADFGRLEQGDDTTTYATIASDGRYVAIQTRARNFFADDDPDPPGQVRVGGIFRFDLVTRQLELVADGDFRDEASNVLQTRGAQNPSISGNGRFVAFSTAQQLVPADTNANIDVYVRDMSVAIRSPGAYDLVSAKDGGDLPAAYAPPGQPQLGGNPGADVTPGASISLDGSKVAFRNTASATDLPDRPGIDTTDAQVFVRDRDVNTTMLVTRTIATSDPAGGAVGPAGISGNGSTVIWTGRNAPLQTELVEGESTDLPGFSYYLWRRIADGPGAPTRRITGMSDPDDPACQPSGPVAFDDFSTGPCYGPLARSELGISANFDLLPAISANGRTVAFLTNSRPRPNVGTGLGLDLYVTDMSPGLTRKEATVELTREGSSVGDGPPIDRIAISADGRRLALTTARTQFVLPALRQIGTPRTTPEQDLYVVDLADRTIERAARSYVGGDIDSAVVGDVSVSGDGGRVAFVSFAGNLFFGDANQRPDAFVVTRQAEPIAEPPPPSTGDEGPGGSIAVDPDRGGPRITATARSRPGGAVVVTVTVPAAGGIKATARATAGKPRKLRTIATKTARARTRGRVKIVLRPVRRYRGELRRRKAIGARLLIGYVASRGGRKLRTSTRVEFRR